MWPTSNDSRISNRIADGDTRSFLLAARKSKLAEHEKDSFVLRGLKWIAARVDPLSLRIPKLILLITIGMVVVSMLALMRLDRDFLPPFNEGAIQVNVLLPPGSSLAKSN